MEKFSIIYNIYLYASFILININVCEFFTKLSLIQNNFIWNFHLNIEEKIEISSIFVLYIIKS